MAAGKNPRRKKKSTRRIRVKKFDRFFERPADKAVSVVFSSRKNSANLSTQWGRAYRVKATKRGVFGAGMDERVSTATVRDLVLRERSSGRKKLTEMVRHFSSNRSRTDQLVWHTDDGYQGHPGALRLDPTTLSHVAGGHGTKDAARAKAARTEFTSGNGKLMERGARTQSRADIETIRSMSIPYEHFQDIGKSKKKIYHAEFGDISNTVNFNKMAKTVHTAREQLKWSTASRLINQGLGSHVSPVMSEYLGQHGNDPGKAQNAFQTAVNANTERRINSAKRSQAKAIPSTQSLRESRKVTGRQRALSDARRV